MKILGIVAILCIAVVPGHGEEPKRREIGGKVEIPENNSCSLEVIRISAPIDSGFRSSKPRFHREVELLLKNNSKHQIELAAYGPDDSPSIVHRFQVWDERNKEWPPLTMRERCGTGWRPFSIAPMGQLKFTVTMAAMPNGTGFRFGIISSDKLHPLGAVTFSGATKLPNGEPDDAVQPAAAVDSKSDGDEKSKPESEDRSQ